MVSPCSDKISRVPPYSRTKLLSTRTGLSPATAQLSRRFRFLQLGHWPGPRSLATTNGVSVDVLSSSYLDISVHWVCLPCGINLLVWVSPFGNPRIKAYSQLPMAYRSVSRPSSPLCAKASTKCSYRHLIGPYMKAEIGQTDQIFLPRYIYLVQSKEIIKFNI